MKLATGRLSPHSVFLPLLLAIAVTALIPSIAKADEQRVSRLGLGLYVGATAVSPEYINERLGDVNEIITPPPPDGPGLSPVDEIKAAPLFQAELRFFISDKLVAIGGVGYMERSEQLSLKPQPDQDEYVVQASIQGVPIYAGLDYYFLPHTSGDVTWRPFAGGGFMSMVEGRGKVGYNLDISTTPPIIVDNFERAFGQGAGFWVEAGVHLMLPGRYSFVGNLYYRYLKLPAVWQLDPLGSPVSSEPVLDENGETADVDWSGIGIRLGIQIDILDRF